MRSNQLGYNAPIIVTENKYYTYEDPAYSITQIPLTHDDLEVLKDVSRLLQQFKGFSHFQEAGEMISRLEAKIRSEEMEKQPVIDFEKNNLLKGMVFYPYLLKEYRNRWFLLGQFKKSKELMTLALDRIKNIQPLLEEKFVEDKEFNAAA